MPVYSEKIPHYADVMTVGDWFSACEGGAFTDYDGHGHPAKLGKMDGSIILKPSQRASVPESATDVVWFNK